MTKQTERPQAVREVEQQLLAALCSPALEPATRVAILAGLRAHKFTNPDHDVILGALENMPRAAIKHIRETLSARLTRLGFPDIDVHPILEMELPSPKKINLLLQQLGR